MVGAGGAKGGRDGVILSLSLFLFLFLFLSSLLFLSFSSVFPPDGRGVLPLVLCEVRWAMTVRTLGEAPQGAAFTEDCVMTGAGRGEVRVDSSPRARLLTILFVYL